MVADELIMKADKDACCICLEPTSANDSLILECENGCGNSSGQKRIHHSCMYSQIEWCYRQRKPIQCPLCRTFLTEFNEEDNWWTENDWFWPAFAGHADSLTTEGHSSDQDFIPELCIKKDLIHGNFFKGSYLDPQFDLTAHNSNAYTTIMTGLEKVVSDKEGLSSCYHRELSKIVQSLMTKRLRATFGSKKTSPIWLHTVKLLDIGIASEGSLVPCADSNINLYFKNNKPSKHLQTGGQPYMLEMGVWRSGLSDLARRCGGSWNYLFDSEGYTDLRLLAL